MKYLVEPTKLHTIGRGFCGTVLAQDKTVFAFKREDGGSARDLLNDYKVHKRLITSLDQATDLVKKASGLDASTVRASISAIPAIENTTAPLSSFSLPSSTKLDHKQFRFQIPQCHQFIRAEDPWWADNLRYFPENYAPSRLLVSERIPPLPANVRELLIEKYCPSHMRMTIRNSVPDQDCLVRPYLGKRRQQSSRPSRLVCFSLRNLPLHLDQLQELNLDVSSYAETMADALAMMHWVGEVDANDVEFVLASPAPENKTMNAKPEQEDVGDCSKANQHFEGVRSAANALGNHTMWVLDFDCCRNMAMDEEGVAQAVRAFLRNDPYFPLPGVPGDEALWKCFRSRYLSTSAKFVQEDHRALLPELFVSQIETRQSERMAHKRLISG
jgi:hypothetical protein